MIGSRGCLDSSHNSTPSLAYRDPRRLALAILTLLLTLLTGLGTACAALPQPPGTTPRPGWPVADASAVEVSHVQRLLGFEDDRVQIEQWVRADGLPWVHQRLLLARDGRVLHTETLEAGAGPPHRPDPDPMPSWPLPLGRHELRRTLRDGLWELRLHRASAPTGWRTDPGVKLGALADTPALAMLSFVTPKGPRPDVAVLGWRTRAPTGTIEGLEVFDLRRARAALLLARGLRLHRQGNTGASRELFRHARDVDPDFPEALYDLACAEALEGAPDEALRLLRRALMLSPHRLRAVAEEDDDLDSLRALPAFKAILGDRR